MRMCILIIAVAVLCICAGCGARKEPLVVIELEKVPLAEWPGALTPSMPDASGTLVKESRKAVIDYSNSADGYVMIRNLEATEKALRVMIKDPGGLSYTYTLAPDMKYEVFPLTGGNGDYQVGVYECVSGNQYAAALSLSLTVALHDEFEPFIRPNKFVNYTSDCETVKKAETLTRDTDDLLKKIAAVYTYVTGALRYDKELAASVQSGYVPDLDAVLKKGTGICFDYAAVTTAMLRSQKIPTKLVVGYTGDVYHAWINVYATETGWIDSVIFFDGESWQLMDPTFASGAATKEQAAKYIGSGTNYHAKYLY